MVIIYQAEFWVITILTAWFFYLVLSVYAGVKDINVILTKFQTAFKTGDFTTISPAEAQKFTETMEGIPPQWYMALYSMAWVFAIPFGIFNKFMYSRLTM